jgi:hypothetical protein
MKIFGTKTLVFYDSMPFYMKKILSLQIINKIDSKIMKKYIPLLLILVLMMSCNGAKKSEVVQPSTPLTHKEKRNKQEALGQAYLSEARTCMARKDFAAARAAVDSMRTNCRRALTARAAGILVMDSISLLEAEEEMIRLSERMKIETDSIHVLKARFDEMFTKAEFYRRKIEHDKNQSPQYP